MWNFRRNSPLLLATALRLLRLYFAPIKLRFNQVNTCFLAQVPLRRRRPQARALRFCRGKRIQVGHAASPTTGAATNQKRGITYGYELTTKTALRPVAVVGGRGDSEPAKFVLVVLFVQHIPLFAAFQDLFLLRGDALADFQLDFLFVAENGRQNLDDVLTNGVAVINEFHFVAGHQHVRDLVRQPDNFLTAQSHHFLGSWLLAMVRVYHESCLD